MKKIAIQIYAIRFCSIFSILILFPLIGFSQIETREELVLTKIKNGKEVYIKSRKRVVVKDFSGNIFRGHITDISNDSVFVESDAISIHDIKKIRVGNSITKIVGGIISGAGLVMTTLGAIWIGFPKGCSPLGGIIYLGLGVGIVILGMPIYFIGHLYHCKTKWKLSSATLTSD